MRQVTRSDLSDPAPDPEPPPSPPASGVGGDTTVHLADLAGERLGSPRPGLFPAWSMTQRQMLEAAHIDPPTVELLGADLSAARWADQPDIDWSC